MQRTAPKRAREKVIVEDALSIIEVSRLLNIERMVLAGWARRGFLRTIVGPRGSCLTVTGILAAQILKELRGLGFELSALRSIAKLLAGFDRRGLEQTFGKGRTRLVASGRDLSASLAAPGGIQSVCQHGVAVTVDVSLDVALYDLLAQFASRPKPRCPTKTRRARAKAGRC